MTLKSKFRLLNALSAAGLLTLAALWIQGQHSSLLTEKSEKTKNLVGIPYSIIEHQYQLELEGKISRSEAQRRSIEAIRPIRYELTNYFWINDEHPMMILHPIKPQLEGTDLTSFKDPTGKAIFVEFARAAIATTEGDYVRYLWPKPGNEKPVAKLSFVRRFAPWGWVIGTGIYIDDVEAAWRESAYTAAGLALICMIPLFIVSFTTWRSTFRRLNDMVARFKDVAEGEGDLTRRIPVPVMDEIGELASWFNVFLEKLHATVKAISGASSQVSGASEEVAGTTQRISLHSQETSAQAGIVSGATGEVSRNLQTVATSTEQMNLSIQEIAKNATEAAKVAAQATKMASETHTIMTKLGSSSAEIGQVIKVITSIAQKTDLLALNATVEAARAGEIGAGFAVVANEVKELAKQTANATEDISRKITAIQMDAKGAVQALQTISGIIDQVSAISATIATAVEEQSATTSEMSRNLMEAAKGAGGVEQNIHGMVQVAENTSREAIDTQQAANQLVELSTALRQLVSQFKIAMDQPRGEPHRIAAAAAVRLVPEQVHSH